MRQKKAPDFDLLLLRAPKTKSAFKKKYCGKKIGTGLYRDVYIFRPDDRYVVKIEKSMATAIFANVTEWRNYINNMSWKRFAKWLAPCEAISKSGEILIQQRVTRIVDGGKKEYPSKIPSLFTDTKYFNFGWIGRNFVCFDYSFLVSTDFRMKRVKWWGNKK